MMTEAPQAIESLTEAVAELAQAIAGQSTAPPTYLIILSSVAALVAALSLGWHIYQHLTRCPQFRFRERRVVWFSVGGPGYRIVSQGTWVTVSGQVTNRGHRAGSLVFCQVQAPQVSIAAAGDPGGRPRSIPIFFSLPSLLL